MAICRSSCASITTARGGGIPKIYRKDAKLLEAALATETNSFLRARYTFYLAQSYRDCGEREGDRATPRHDGALGEEVFYSLYQAARFGNPSATIRRTFALYRRATEASPSRAEALHGASRLCRQIGDNARGRAFAKEAIDLPAPADGLFVEQWIYDYGALDEFAINAYWAGCYRDCLEASLRAIGGGKIPPGELARFAQNARFALERLPPETSLDAPRPPAAAPIGALGRRDLRSVLPDPAPRVLLAILAKQKAPVLPLYLKCLEALDYPKSSIVLSIRTNNNRDRTREILREWIKRVAGDYADVDYDERDVAEPVQSFGVHEWNATRFKVLAAIRAESLRKAIAYGCAFYFVADVDNFLVPQTLRELVALNLPIVAPLLRHVDPASRYSNFHADIDGAGYFLESERYDKILSRALVGVIEVPVVHCAYLVRADAIARLSYDDGSGRHEYVVFSHSARSQGVPQYFDNRQVYGLLTLNDDEPARIAGQLAAIERALAVATTRGRTP